MHDIGHDLAPGVSLSQEWSLYTSWLRFCIFEHQDIHSSLSGVASLCLLACILRLWPSRRVSLSGVASVCLLAWALCLWSSRWVSLSEVASLCLLAWALCLRSSTWASLSGVVSLRLLACNPSRSTETTKSCLTVWQTNTNYYAVTQNSTTVRSLTLLLTSCIPLSAPRKSPLSLSLSFHAFRYLYALWTVLFVAEDVFAFSVQH